MNTDGRAIANFVLDFCEAKGRSVTNLSLQKIIYFCHVWSLIKLRRPLVKHQFQAWKFGPVLQFLYREFKAYDRNPIVGRATKIDLNTGARMIVKYEFDIETESLLNQVVDFYTQLSASGLVELSHVRGGPWYQAWNHRGRINPGMKISDDQIMNYYSQVRPPYSTQ